MQTNLALESDPPHSGPLDWSLDLSRAFPRLKDGDGYLAELLGKLEIMHELCFSFFNSFNPFNFSGRYYYHHFKGKETAACRC